LEQEKKRFEEEKRFVEQEKQRTEEEKRKIEQFRKEDEEKKKILEQLEADRILAEKARIEEETRKKKEEELIREREKIEQQETMRNMKGFLSKKGHVVKNWKVRYFLIKSGEVYYYLDSSMTKLQGHFSLLNATLEIEGAPLEDKKYCFTVTTKQNKKFVLCASTDGERQEWVNAMEFVSNETVSV